MRVMIELLMYRGRLRVEVLVFIELTLLDLAREVWRRSRKFVVEGHEVEKPYLFL